MGVQGAVGLEQSPWFAPWLLDRRHQRRRLMRRWLVGLVCAGSALGALSGLGVQGRLAWGRSHPEPPRVATRPMAPQRSASGVPWAELGLAPPELAAGSVGRVVPVSADADVPFLPDRTADLPDPRDPLVVDFVSGREILRGDESTGAIALTFDCEGTGEDLEAVLDILAKHRARGTFFLMAPMARWWPEAAARVVRAGHQLASHGEIHDPYPSLSDEEIAADLAAFEHAMGEALAAARIVPPPLRFFRFPYGERDERALAAVAAAGYQSVHWTIDPRGWMPGRSPEMVEAIVAEHAAPGEIVLMHCPAAADRAALPAVLELLAERGLRTATISEIVRYEDLPRAAVLQEPAGGEEARGASEVDAPGSPDSP